jgi:hypothetical protein
MAKDTLLRENTRIERLERLMYKLVWAFARQGTEQDGGWGYPSFGEELFEIITQLEQQKSSRDPVD